MKERVGRSKKKNRDKRNKTRSLIELIPTGSQVEPGSGGKLIIIGGHEDRKQEKRVLKEVAQEASNGKLVVVTLASRSSPKTLWNEYRKAFKELGVREVVHLGLQNRGEVTEEDWEETLDGARVVFFTGGDQLKITSQLGGTAICRQIRALFRKGMTISGTSAGASVMSDTMILSGNSDESHRIGGGISMAPGLGFLRGVVIDQHFAERGRIGRLLGVLAQNPEHLAIGIDEDTAIVVECQNQFTTIGSGAVYVLDGRGITNSNISEANPDSSLSLFDVRMHVLSAGDQFDLVQRRPSLRNGNVKAA